MAVRKSGADVERQRGAIRGLLGQVPLPIRGKVSWDTLVAIVRDQDDNNHTRYTEDEKKRLHTARLLIDKEHPTQKMGKVAAREISIALSEYHEATRPLYAPRKVDDQWEKRPTKYGNGATGTEELGLWSTPPATA